VTKRGYLKAVGIAAVLGYLGVRSLVGLSEEPPGWRNYFGGFVYAPFVLLIVFLTVIAYVVGWRRRNNREGRERTGRTVFRRMK
jgi:hypothetical protein